jgi:site-specific DNA-methyltransferase (adenine-specific)
MIDYDIYRDIKQSQADGLSQRKTADKLQISRITVKRYWDMTDSEFEEHIPVSKQKISKNPHVLKKKSKFQLNTKNKGNGLDLLLDILDASIAVCFFDPQYRGILDTLNYGNEGVRQQRRIALPQMNEETIMKFVQQIHRVMKPSGYLFLWIDKFHLCNGSINHWIQNTTFRIVDLITWEKDKFGMGYRSRRKSEYLVVIQKEPCQAKATWIDHSIPDVWKETVRVDHPHSKPIELQKRLIQATTNNNDVILDPCAGSFSVLMACIMAKRSFIGTDIE